MTQWFDKTQNVISNSFHMLVTSLVYKVGLLT